MDLAESIPSDIWYRLAIENIKNDILVEGESNYWTGEGLELTARRAAPSLRISTHLFDSAGDRRPPPGFDDYSQQPEPFGWQLNYWREGRIVAVAHLRAVLEISRIAAICRGAHDAMLPLARALYHAVHYYNDILTGSDRRILRPELGLHSTTLPVEWFVHRIELFYKRPELEIRKLVKRERKRSRVDVAFNGSRKRIALKSHLRRVRKRLAEIEKRVANK